MISLRSRQLTLSQRLAPSLLWTAPLILLAACSGGSPMEPAATDSIDSGNNNGTESSTESSLPILGEAQGGGAFTLASDELVACDAPTEHIQQRTLELINIARSQPRMCGNESFQATTSLSWDTQLLQAADRHSVDMTQHNFFDHTGSDGSTVATRVDESDYDWQAVGENIAAGQRSAAEVVAGWLDSPGHCKNMMNPVFTEVAVTCVVDSGADFTRYWTTVLATPF